MKISEHKEAVHNCGQYLMEDWVVSGINCIPSVNISCDKKVSLPFTQFLSLMGTSMTTQDCIRVDIVCVIVSPADVIGGHEHVIKILQLNTRDS